MRSKGGNATKRTIKRPLIFVLIIGIILTNGLIAFASDDAGYVEDGRSPYVHKDIRSSIVINEYRVGKDTQLYHVIANNDFSAKDNNAWADSGIDANIQIKKGDIILMFDVPELRDTAKVAMITGSGYILETDRSNLKADKKGALIKSTPIEVEKNYLTGMSRSISGRGKYVYEKPDIKSKKIGVVGKGSVFATYKDAYYENLPQIFLSIQMPGDQIGYIYAGDERYPSSFSVGHFTNES